MSDIGTPTARTLEARENEMISLAVDAAEKKLRDGTAPTAIIVHYLRLGTVMAEKEKRELEEKIKLLEAKTESLKASKMDAEYYDNLVSVIKSYQGANYEPTDQNIY